MGKTLVSYFSVSGVTAKAAEGLAKLLGADLFEIRPEKPYNAEDINYMDKQSRSSVEMADPDCRPAMAGGIDLGQYDCVFVGFPIWWGREPSVVDTFLTSGSFAGKKIIPFATSGGSGLGETAERIQSLVGEAACVTQGRRISFEDGAEQLKKWIGELGL